MSAIVDYEKYWAEQAAMFAKQAPVPKGGGEIGETLSTRGGTFSLGDQVLGPQLCVLVLDSIWTYTYFPEKWAEGKEAAPICYAYGRSSDEMMPHHSMQSDLNYFKPQSGFDPQTNMPRPCGTCPHNQWGSAPQGKGKACQNRDRLVMIPAGWYTPRPRSMDYDLQMAVDPRHFETAEQVKLNLPVTSVRAWREYVANLAQTTGRPPFGVITRVYLERDPKTQFKVGFEMLDLVSNELIPTIQARFAAVHDKMAEPFSAPEA